MALDKTRGRWTALFNRQTDFSDEIHHAREIGAQWKRSPHQRDIILDEIPGWLPPLWGSDKHWLYIRRPEGIWKARIPADFHDHTPALLYQHRTRSAGMATVGALSIGEDLFDRGGWHSARGSKNIAGAFEKDLERHPSSLGVTLAVDAIGGDLWDALPLKGDGLLLKAGDDFCSEPAFTMQGDWLIAQDRDTGWTIAYLLEPNSDARKALDDGALWLRFRGPWLRTLDVNVPSSNALSAAP